jgi:iron complex transport system permease protein
MKLKFSILILLALGALLLFPMLGNTGMPTEDVLLKFRIPRVLTAFIAGVALATSGMIFQALFRNPLATPFTLGVSGGAALGAQLWIRFGIVATAAGIAGTSLAGFGGAIAAVLLVYGMARAKGGFATDTLLLAGVAVNFFFGSLLLLIQYLSDAGEIFRMVRWLMGSFSVIGFSTPISLSLFVVAGLSICGLLTREMNLLLTGDELAGARGVDVHRTRKQLFFAASLMTGAAVAFCGPIGFVGMMVPHICRKLFGSNHRTLLPAVILFGGFFMTACDGLARILLAPSELPVGLVTALLGGPFFIGLLFRKS